MNEEGLNDAEWEEAQRIHKALRESYAKDPEGTTQAMKDAVQLPRMSGDIK